MAESNYQFRQWLLQVHKPGRRMPGVRPKENSIEITDKWTIWTPDGADRILVNAAKDLQDYFSVSMGIDLKVQFGGEIPQYAIAYVLENGLSGTQYRIRVTADQVILAGGSSRTAAQAGYYAEDLMNFAEGPFLQLQDTLKEPLYRTRMTHGGYGMDLYPDQHLSAIAHAGFTAILLFVRGYNHCANSYQDFNELIYRAAGFGLDVYAYGYIKSLVYPEGDEGKAYYDSTYGEFFRRCPGFKGLVLVGESCQFRSRDPRTSGMFMQENRKPDGSLLVNKPNPGWYPCSDYPLLVNMIKDTIRSVNPEADLVFWTYNWSFRPEEPRLELIRNLPKDISLEVTFEKNHEELREGVLDHIKDYSLYFPGPGSPFTSEAEEAKAQGLPLYAMTNTAGATWDFGVIPYVPAPGQWLRRIQGMRKYHDQCGLCGLMESHHFGFYPSFITDLAKWMYHSPDTPEQEILRKLAARDFSEETADAVLEAWECFSEGIRHTVSNNTDQYGPYRIGPSYPLLMDKDYEIPSEKYAYFGHNSICNPKYPYPLDTEEQYQRIHHELNYAYIALDNYEKGADLLETIIPQIHPKKRDAALRMANLGRFMARTVQTAIHTKKWLLAKKQQDWQEMLRIGQAEIRNAEAAIPLAEFDSRLGWEPSMEYMADPAHILWKIQVTKEVMVQEVAPLLK